MSHSSRDLLLQEAKQAAAVHASCSRALPCCPPLPARHASYHHRPPTRPMAPEARESDSPRADSESGLSWSDLAPLRVPFALPPAPFSVESSSNLLRTLFESSSGAREPQRPDNRAGRRAAVRHCLFALCVSTASLPFCLVCFHCLSWLRHCLFALCVFHCTRG